MPKIPTLAILALGKAKLSSKKQGKEGNDKSDAGGFSDAARAAFDAAKGGDEVRFISALQSAIEIKLSE